VDRLRAVEASPVISLKFREQVKRQTPIKFTLDKRSVGPMTVGSSKTGMSLRLSESGTSAITATSIGLLEEYNTRAPCGERVYVGDVVVAVDGKTEPKDIVAEIKDEKKVCWDFHVPVSLPLSSRVAQATSLVERTQIDATTAAMFVACGCASPKGYDEKGKVTQVDRLRAVEASPVISLEFHEVVKREKAIKFTLDRKAVGAITGASPSAATDGSAKTGMSLSREESGKFAIEATSIGVLEDYNTRAPRGERVYVGDFVVAVNGKAEPKDILAELKDKEKACWDFLVEPAEGFVVELARPTGASFGLALNLIKRGSVTNTSLAVALVKIDGIADTHNKNNPAKALAVGHRFVEVNGIRLGGDEMAQQFQTADYLRIVVNTTSPLPPSSPIR